MDYLERKLEQQIITSLERDKSLLILGPRQTGKTTLLGQLNANLRLSLIRPEIRQRYEKKPELLSGEVETLSEQLPGELPLIIIDEVQKIPSLLDTVQDLIDRKIAQFILSGSSARKLRRGSSINLLPGRVVSLRLDPLNFDELLRKSLLPDLLYYGSLPGIIAESDNDARETDLESYVTTYLEEEIRVETLVRNVGTFSRFLELAAIESGNIMNFSRISQDIGVAHTTIASYYEILEDCLIVERISPLTKSIMRNRLTKSSKYIFFDLGVRRVAAGEGPKLSRERLGFLFEHFVGLELIRRARLSKFRTKIKFWRDHSGPEVDWIVDRGGVYTPVEVKWTDSPTLRDIRHLKTFMGEYDCEIGYVVCQTPRKIKLDELIYGLPWQDLGDLFAD